MYEVGGRFLGGWQTWDRGRFFDFLTTFRSWEVCLVLARSRTACR
jgi:hypothetical protein